MDLPVRLPPAAPRNRAPSHFLAWLRELGVEHAIEESFAHEQRCLVAQRDGDGVTWSGVHRHHLPVDANLDERIVDAVRQLRDAFEFFVGLGMSNGIQWISIIKIDEKE